MYTRLKCQFWARSGTLTWLSGSILAALRVAAPVIAMAAWLLAAGAARAQGAGYMRIVTAGGRQMVGESTDKAHFGWIPFRQASMPSASEIAAIAQEPSAGSADKSVHRPVVIIKDRDKSSLGLLGAMTSHQRFSEVDIVFTKGDEPVAQYKLTDATVISIRAGSAQDGMDAPLEQLRINYAKIEIER